MSHQDQFVVIVDDNPDISLSLKKLLELSNYSVTCYSDAQTALNCLHADWAGIVISDVCMPGMDGLDFLSALKAQDADLPVILMTGHGDIDMAVQAMRCGAYDFIEKPFCLERILEVVERATEKRHLIMENRQLKASIAQTGTNNIIGKSAPMQALKAKILQLARADVNTLIEGETGTGKELVARSLHDNSDRHNGPFVAINCAALPETMIEAELFGHTAGAFTDAKKARMGKFEYANQGTIFLDEIESIPRTLAVKILRVLQERKVERLGTNDTIDIDIRVIAATKTDLKQLADQGGFREDLYYRLNVLQLYLPPLRQRGEDIVLLFRFFMMQAAERFNLPLPALSMAMMDKLTQHDWPGNVRELMNMADRFVLTGMLLDQQDPSSLLQQDKLKLPDLVEQYEKRLIEQTLSQTKGVIKRTYEELGIPRKTLYDKLAKYDINRKRFEHN